MEPLYSPDTEPRGRDKARLPISGLYRSRSTSAQEIVARDLSSYLKVDDDDPKTPCSESEADAEVSISTLFLRPTGISFGPSPRPSLGPQESSPPVPPLTWRERTLSRDAERSLLRDNFLLPPKHGFPDRGNILRRLYRYLFSTKVRSVRRVPSALSEVTPLLQEAFEPTYAEESRRWEAAVAANVIQTTWQREVMTLAEYTRSLAVTFLLHYSVTMVGILGVGRIGMVELGAVSSTVTANITCYSPIQGLATSLDTLCAQAYGSGHKHLVGLQCQRMACLLWLLLLPLAALWYRADVVLIAIIPERETALLAAQYLRILIIGTPGVAAFEVGKRFVQAQGLFHATTYVLMVGASCNALLSWLLVWKLDWGFTGAPVAIVVTQLLLPVLLLGYVFFVDGRQCWGGLSRRVFWNWGPMLRLALPGMLMIEAQYFAFELLTIVSGQFGDSSLAAQSILVTLGSASYQVPFAISVAASTRVANLIGARLSDAAWTSAKVALLAGFLIGSLNMVLLGVGRHALPALFTADEDVIAVVAQALPTLAIMQVFDATAATLHGLLRGIGRQFVGGCTNLVSFYIVALPISFTTSFALNWKLPGLWVGVTVGLTIVTVVELIYILNADWDHAVIEAENRMRTDELYGNGTKSGPSEEVPVG